jgi:predicted site-specific integrase-resolvase
MRKKTYTTKEAAEILEIETKSVQRLCKDGVLDCQKNVWNRWVISAASVRARARRLKREKKSHSAFGRRA